MFFSYVLFFFFFYVSRGDLPKKKNNPKKKQANQHFTKNFRQYIKSFIIKVISKIEKLHNERIGKNSTTRCQRRTINFWKNQELPSFYHWYSSCFIWSWCLIHTITFDGYVGPTIISNLQRDWNCWLFHEFILSVYIFRCNINLFIRKSRNVLAL